MPINTTCQTHFGVLLTATAVVLDHGSPMTIARKIEIDMAHRIPNHSSKCKNIHGHRYSFELAISDKVVDRTGDSSEGMVLDFGIVKELMLKVIDEPLDHGFMLSSTDPILSVFAHDPTLSAMKLIVTDYIPTVENITRDYYFKLKKELEAIGIAIQYLKVWETPNSFAVFSGESDG